jgi:hypothetical protein
MSSLEIVLRILPTVPVAAVTWLRRPKNLVPSRHGGFWADRPVRRNRLSCATFVVMLDIPSLRQGASPDMLRAQMTEGG